MHLHAHDTCSRTALARGRGGAPRGAAETVLEIAPYGGYGPNQTMHLMRDVAAPGAATAVRRGDELRVSCVFNTLSRTRSTRFGVNRGDEMCGPLLMYTPSDPNLPEKTNTTCTAVRALTDGGGPRRSFPSPGGALELGQSRKARKAPDRRSRPGAGSPRVR